MTTVAIIGGGLIGSAAAVWLAADGFDVTLFERDLEGRPASTGNAGASCTTSMSADTRACTRSTLAAASRSPCRVCLTRTTW